MAERAGDLHEILLRHGQFAQAQTRVKRAVQSPHQPRGIAPHARPVDETPAPRTRSHENVLGDRQLIEHHGFLVNHTDAELLRVRWRADAHALAAQRDATAIGLVDAGEDFDQCGFAGTVFADQGRDRARIKRKINRLERARTAEGLADAGQLQQGACRRWLVVAQKTFANSLTFDWS